MTTRIHPTAIVEEGVSIGSGTAVWHHAHLRRGARIGRDCIIGGKSYVAGDVVIADRCKINAAVYLCAGVMLEEGVMVAAGAIFTNDRYPRATTPDLGTLRGSGVDDHTLPTRVGAGASVGAGAVIGCGLTIGRFAMVGMGAVVTRSVPDHHLVVGNPARTLGVVCRCGTPMGRGEAGGGVPADGALTCPECGRDYQITAGIVTEARSPSELAAPGPCPAPSLEASPGTSRVAVS